MKFTLTADALADAAGFAAKAISARPANPILAGLLIEAQQGGLRISGFDYEKSARTQVAADVETPGHVLLQGKMFTDIIRKFGKKPVTIAIDGAKVKLTSGSAVFTMHAMPVAEFPPMPDLPAVAGTVDGDAFAASVGQIIGAASTDDSVAILMNVQMVTEGDTITLYRCPKTSCKNQIVEPGWLPASHAIDWTLKGQRIGDRKRELSPKTVARIQAGLLKFGAEPVSIDSVRGSQIISPVNREPFQTQTTAYTRSLLVPVEGRLGKEAARVTDPIRTQTTRNETGILTPPKDHMLMEYYGNGQMHKVSKAIPTITTHDRFAMITTLRGTNAPKDVGQPLDTFAANGLHHGLAEWKVPEIDDCEFRMLEPHEIKAGMAFPKEYIMLGNKREQVKMAGNAVTPPAARDLVACMAETLTAA